MRPPHPQPFLAASAGEPTPDADALLLGLCTDGGVSFRPGAEVAPPEIRAFSDSIETWSPRAERDLEELTVVDLGDYEGERTGIEEAVASVLDVAWTSRDKRPLLVSMGGDHSVTPPAVRAVAARVPDLALVGFDAHLDLREDYPGDHACTYRRVADHGVPCFVMGPRSGARHEWVDSSKVLAHLSRTLDAGPVIAGIGNRPVYVTLDIDVLDPACAPGTGTPEAGGPRFDELLSCLEALSTLNIVAFDLVEVAPPLDPSGITLGAAAILIREVLLRYTKRP